MTDSTLNGAELAGNPTETAPVAARSRIRSVDTLRGVALLGILLMNIIAFGLPYASYFNPAAWGNLEGINLTTFMVMDIFVEGGMRAVFSMLFGAGMLLFIAKPEADPLVVRGLYYRRTFLLVLFGLFNAYILLWPGDILYAYGMAGFLLYLFRNQSPGRLAAWATAIFLLLALSYVLGYYGARELQEEIRLIEALPAGTELSPEQQTSLDQWDTYMEQLFIAPELVEEDLRIRKSGYLETFRFLAPVNLGIQTGGLLISGLWDALGMMLLGMACMKWGLFDTSRSFRFYGLLCGAGFAIGMLINYVEVRLFVDSGFEVAFAASNRVSYDLGRLALALGYIGLVMLICKAEMFTRLRAALAAVGQMALTNYLMQTLICNAIFMGWGFNLLGELERYQIYYVVAGVWVFQLVLSPLWLRRFRFGPAEWLWRSLTYGRKQSMRLQAA